MQKIPRTADCVWISEESNPGDKAIFRKRFELKCPPETATAYIAADTKYFLYVNGKEAVYEGSLFRESMPGCGYVDEIDLAPYLKAGDNVIAILVWYYGNEGRNNVDSRRAGLYFACDAINLYGDAFLCRKHPAYYIPKNDPPSYLYGGDHLGFDANADIPDWRLYDAEESDFFPAVAVDGEKWGDMYIRPVPFHRVKEAVWADVELKAPQSDNGETVYEVDLPYAMACFPLIKASAEKGAKVTVYTDRYMVNGGPGDEMHIYRSHRVEVVCKAGETDFQSIEYLFGEKLIIRCSGNIKDLKIGWRETSYNTDIVGSFTCSDPILNRLIEKAARTLVVCMRDNFMDCPDRERGQWIGDVSVQIPQVMFLLDDRAKLLVKKAIHDFLYLRKGSRLVGNVPGVHFSELPSQSLVAISEWGLIAQYVKYTGDTRVLHEALEPMAEYLKLWDIEKSGLVSPRTGDWRWFDHLYNVDDTVLENAWYASALRFALYTADKINDHRYDEFLNSRLKGIEAVFHKTFWTENGYSSGTVFDDRANAAAVLAGLCKEECYSTVIKLLTSVHNATPYMENYVLTAMCEMGYVKEAYSRMRSRYLPLAENENSTLWEDFSIRGTANHAWSGAPVTIAFRYFMGIDTCDGFKTVSFNPQKDLFSHMQCSFYANDRLHSYKIGDE